MPKQNKKNPTLNYAKKKLSDAHNNTNMSTLDMGKENTFDQINFDEKKRLESRKPLNSEFGEDNKEVEIISSAALEDNNQGRKLIDNNSKYQG